MTTFWAISTRTAWGDAKLYSRLHRGTVIYVKYWDRFLIWGGHHWIEDDFDMAAQRIEDVCELYLRLAESKQAEAAEETDKNEAGQDRRSSLGGFTPGEPAPRHAGAGQTAQMLRRIRDPLVVLPKQIDQQHYVKACPNGVIDLRTGELRPGRPDEYILNAIVTEYDPELLRKDDPCPETNRFLLSSMDGDQEAGGLHLAPPWLRPHYGTPRPHLHHHVGRTRAQRQGHAHQAGDACAGSDALRRRARGDVLADAADAELLGPVSGRAGPARHVRGVDQRSGGGAALRPGQAQKR